MEGSLNAFSVGFMVFDSENLPKDTEPKNPTFRLGEHILEAYLDEISSVTVPADPYALTDGPARLQNAIAQGSDLKPEVHDGIYGHCAQRKALMAATASILGVSRRCPAELGETERSAAFGRLAEYFRDLALEPPEYRKYTADEWEALEKRYALRPAEQRHIARASRPAKQVEPRGEADPEPPDVQRLLEAYRAARPRSLADFAPRRRATSPAIEKARKILASLGPVE